MTDADRIRTARTRVLRHASPASRIRAAETGALIADQLRRDLPDDPDPTIARILVTTATFFWSLGPGLSGAQVASGLALAAADLAHLDLESPPPC